MIDELIKMTIAYIINDTKLTNEEKIDAIVDFIKNYNSK